MIRKANIKDAESIGRILCQVNNVHAKVRPDIFIEGKKKFSDEELKEILKNSEPEFYVYEINNEVCAYVCVEIHEYEECEFRHKRKELYVEDLCVDENYRRQGIASKLLDYVVELGRNKACDYLTLHVWELNEGARVFYEKEGFSPLKTLMEKKL